MQHAIPPVKKIPSPPKSRVQILIKKEYDDGNTFPGDINAVKYVFYAKLADSSLRDSKEKEGAIFALNLPPQYASLAAKMHIPDKGKAEFGHMSFWSDAPHSLVNRYYPYDKLSSKVYGLADFLEFFVTCDLKKNGASSVAGVGAHSTSRDRQLLRRGITGLYGALGVPISEMKKKLQQQIRQMNTYIVVKKIANFNDTSPSKSYLFFLSSEKPKLGKVEGTCSEHIVAVKKVPKIYGKLEDCLEPLGADSIGELHWKLEGSTATSFFYFPKKRAKDIGGLGYYLDILTCNDIIKSYSIQHMLSKRTPSASRLEQMMRVGNMPGEPKEIRTYMENNAKAVRYKTNKFQGKILVESEVWAPV